MNKAINIILLLMIPVILTIGNYISINHGNPNDKYFIILSFSVILAISFYTKVPQRFKLFLSSVKIEMLKVSWIKKDETIIKIIKLLCVIIACGVIISIMDKLISTFIINTILYG